jgi:hypothetical protein
VYLRKKAMINLDFVNMKPGEFTAAYEKAKAARVEKKPFNTAEIPLPVQLERFEAASFSDDDDRALDEDLQYI